MASQKSTRHGQGPAKPMRRRDFTKLALAGAVGTIAAGKVRAQPASARYTIGFLGGADQQTWDDFLKALRQELELFGWEYGAGKDFVINDKYGEGNKLKHKNAARDLLSSSIIVTAGTEPVKAAIEIVSGSSSPPPIVVASAREAGTIPSNVKVSGFLNGQAARSPGPTTPPLPRPTSCSMPRPRRQGSTRR
jgi:hypothetical protein